MTKTETGNINREIDITTSEIEATLWQNPADMDRARLLISKRMGLRIVLGEVSVKLRPVPKLVHDADAVASVALAA